MEEGRTPFLARSAGAEPFLARASGEERSRYHSLDVFFRSFTPIVKRASQPQRILNEDDTADLPRADEPSFTRQRLAGAWSRRRSIPLALLSVLGSRLLVSGTLQVTQLILQFVSPVLIGRLIVIIQTGEGGLSAGLLCVAGMSLAQLCQTLINQNYMIMTNRIGLCMETSLKCLVFEKTLRLSQPAAASFEAGALMNIMQVDTGRLSGSAFWGQQIFTMPLMLTIAVVMIYQRLSWAVLAPLVLGASMSPLNSLVVKRLMAAGKARMMALDARVKLLTESLHAVRLCKFLAWEDQITGLIEQSRQKELSLITTWQYWRCGIELIFSAFPLLLPLLTFGSYVLLGGKVSPELVFPSLALFDLLNAPMSMLPVGVTFMAQARVSAQRIEKLLLAEELDECRPAEDSDATDYVRGNASEPTPAELHNVAFRWAQQGAQDSQVSSQPVTLSVPSLVVPKGKLTMVVGGVGAGKSTLLGGILHEAPLVAGRVLCNGSTAYCSQTPWQMHGTIRENILMGEELDPSWFKKVVRACALVPDLKQMKNGSATIIGERGINLSGGQKARVSLARATYAGASFYLLDDPLSAVDTHVAAHLMEHCFGSANGLLKNTTRLLVTHQLQFMNHADLVVVVKDGKVVAAKPPSELSEEELELAGVEAPEDKPLEAPPAMVREVSGGGGDVLIRQVSSEPLELSVDDAESSRLELGPSSDSRKGSWPVSLLQRSTSLGSSEPVPTPLSLQRSSTSPSENDTDVGVALTELKKRQAAPAVPSEAPTEASSTKAEDDDWEDNVDADAAESSAHEEEREEGSMSRKVWAHYFRAMGACTFFTVLLVLLGSNSLQLFATNWIASSDGDNIWGMLAVYSCALLGAVILIVTNSVIFVWTSVKVSRNIHEKTLWAVLRSPMSWFDTTPTGRVVNRFNQDLSKIDQELSMNVRSFMQQIIIFLFAIGTMAAFVPAIFVVFLPCVYFYFKINRLFATANRDLQRLKSKNVSPILIGLDEATSGGSTIRAFEKDEFFKQRNLSRINTYMQLSVTLTGCSAWQQIRLKLLSASISAAASLLLVLHSNVSFIGMSISGASAGLVLQYANKLSGALEGICNNIGNLELSLVSLERVTGFLELKSEAALHESGDTALSWPTAGEITFENVEMRYREALPLSLNGISFKVPGGTSVGVVGRTGAGKSTITQTLFRLSEIESGTISIDGVNIASLGLHKLRKALAIIPQDPLGFTGSLRFNLDPFDEKQDDELWAELDKVQMGDFFRNQDESLSYKLTAGGENLSVGQRQLVCAARAFLRGCKILVLDEATANVDFKTDGLIQEVLKNEVTTKKLTTFTIAHRINTILGNDNVLVMDAGKCIEFGPTQKLANDPKSAFHSFVHPAGKDDS